MANKAFWQEVLQKFSSYEGNVTNFCKEQSISKSQFYYHKRQLENNDTNNKLIFQAVTLKEREITSEIFMVNPSTNVKIKVGKASIDIPASETGLVKMLVEELIRLC